MNYKIQGHLRGLTTISPKEILERLERIISGRFYSEKLKPKGGFYILNLYGNMSTYEFLCAEDRLIMLISVVDTYSVLWIGDKFPCPIVSKMTNYGDIMKEHTTYKSVKKLTRKQKREKEQLGIIQAIKDGNAPSEIYNRKKK